MKAAPLILISPSTQSKGVEFSDTSISLSDRYPWAAAAAGGIPWVIPCLPSADLVAECVRRCDGVMLTGGDDVQTELYAPAMPPALKKTVSPPAPARDLLEILMIAEVFRQRKPLLAICRGEQILNVALGGGLIADIPSQLPKALRHNRSDLKDELVHDVQLASGSLMARIFGKSVIGVNSSHHQAATQVPKAMQVTATAPDGVIEALELSPEARASLPYMLAIQFHPERLFERHREFVGLFRSFTDACRASSRKRR